MQSGACNSKLVHNLLNVVIISYIYEIIYDISSPSLCISVSFVFSMSALSVDC